MVMGEETLETDLLVIGGGSGGYAAAFRAADLGLNVTLVTDEKQLGGVCLHRGCIPSKALLHVSDLISDARHASELGITFGEPQIDLNRLRDWKNKVSNRLARGLGMLSKERDINVIKGRARFESSEQVRLTESDIARIRFNHAIIATGAHPTPPPTGTFAAGSRIMDATAALNLPDIPDHLLVVGGSYIGLELGSLYAALGSRVTIVEITDGLLPGTDPELVRVLTRAVRDRFEAIHFGATVSKLAETDDHVTVQFEGGGGIERTQYDRVLVDLGREPNTADLGLKNTQVEVDEQGRIRVDAERRTTDQRIFAVGDVTAGPMLAHKALYEGKIAAEVIAGQPAAFDVRAMPQVVYTQPQIAWCGMTEQEANDAQLDFVVSRFPWQASGKALADHKKAGLTKLIINGQTGIILGVGIVGHGAAELIAEGALAVEMGATARDPAMTIHPHPTLSETLAEAAEVFLSTPTHIAP